MVYSTLCEEKFEDQGKQAQQKTSIPVLFFDRTIHLACEIRANTNRSNIWVSNVPFPTLQ